LTNNVNWVASGRQNQVQASTRLFASTTVSFALQTQPGFMIDSGVRMVTWECLHARFADIEKSSKKSGRVRPTLPSANLLYVVENGERYR
jgi:hypothetical protein